MTETITHTKETGNNTASLAEQLFAAGAHFGFRKSRRHPTVRPFIYTTKDGADIFDITKTATLLQEAKEVLRDAAARGKTVLLVSTKNETSALVRDAAQDAGLPHVTNRWIGGMLTNFAEIKKRIARLNELVEKRESGELAAQYTKWERGMIDREIDELRFHFEGIASLTAPPDMLLIVDPRYDHIALAEARSLGIPTVGIMSSDNDAGKVDHPVLANDALQKSVSFVLRELMDGYREGAQAQQQTHTS